MDIELNFGTLSDSLFNNEYDFDFSEDFFKEEDLPFTDNQVFKITRDKYRETKRKELLKRYDLLHKKKLQRLKKKEQE